jgi:hypothetical protein
MVFPLQWNTSRQIISHHILKKYFEQCTPFFKSLLKNILLQYTLYSVDEYYQQNFNDFFTKK